MKNDSQNVAVDSIVLITGGFDPIHRGHLSYIDASKKLGSKLIVGVNSDEWLTRKKGRSFMPIDERVAILSALGSVDEVITFDDSDDRCILTVISFMQTVETELKLISLKWI